MATRTENPVTLAHEDADQIAKMLIDYADAQRRMARKTKNYAVQNMCERTANAAQKQAQLIIESLYTWTLPAEAR